MSVIVMEVLLSTALAIIFLAGAVPKLRHPKGFVLAVLEYRVLPPRLSWFYARLVPPLEFLLALLLLTGTAVRSAAVLISVLLLSFIFAVGINLARGRDLDCHCFGKAASTTLLVSPRTEGLDRVGLNEPEDEILKQPEQDLPMDMRQRTTCD